MQGEEDPNELDLFSGLVALFKRIAAIPIPFFSPLLLLFLLCFLNRDRARQSEHIRWEKTALRSEPLSFSFIIQQDSKYWLAIGIGTCNSKRFKKFNSRSTVSHFTWLFWKQPMRPSCSAININIECVELSCIGIYKELLFLYESGIPCY